MDSWVWFCLNFSLKALFGALQSESVCQPVLQTEVLPLRLNKHKCCPLLVIFKHFRFDEFIFYFKSLTPFMDNSSSGDAEIHPLNSKSAVGGAAMVEKEKPKVHEKFRSRSSDLLLLNPAALQTSEADFRIQEHGKNGEWMCF